MTNKPRKEVIDAELQSSLMSIVKHYDKEDRSLRELQIRNWKQLKLYWNGFQRIWLNSTAHDWRIWETETIAQSSGDDSYYDKPVNVFRAYLESIIAALSITTPSVYCKPDDADQPDDINTAKAGNKIYELLSNHNNATLLWLHALFILCTEGTVFSYHYTHTDEKYGTYENDVTEDVESELEQKTCPTCGETLKSSAGEISDGTDAMLMGDNFCPNCMVEVEPQIEQMKVTTTKLTGKEDLPKSRQCIEIYGGLFVKVANYARTLSETPYLIYSCEKAHVFAQTDYPDLDIKPTNKDSNYSGGMYNTYERWGRLSTQYQGMTPENVDTVSKVWLRPETFLVEKDEKLREKLQEKFPKGVRVEVVNDQFALAEKDELDLHWDASKDPMGDYIHIDPIGKLLVSIQEITNDLISLTLQTIEQGVTQIFADPGVLNFDQYGQLEVSPGSITPATPKSGKGLSDAFFQVKTAALGGEVLPFGDKVQEAGQIVSGAMPQIYGGAAPNSSKTASQYDMARTQAMQRLQNPWKMLCIWWKESWNKIIPAYIEDVNYDEKFVKKEENGSFVNVWIKKSELEGKIGGVELEASDELPVSWVHRKNIIMHLMEMQNEGILEALTAPENIPAIKDALGLNDFVLPGEDSRQKQNEEIKELILGEPQESPETPGVIMPSVLIDPDLDDHAIEGEICRRFLTSLQGQQLKKTNNGAYQNVLLHYKFHKQALMMSMVQQSMASGDGNETQEAPEKVME